MVAKYLQKKRNCTWTRFNNKKKETELLWELCVYKAGTFERAALIISL
jgi:hypothetical protein